jgi:hypothetical protein
MWIFEVVVLFIIENLQKNANLNQMAQVWTKLNRKMISRKCGLGLCLVLGLNLVLDLGLNLSLGLDLVLGLNLGLGLGLGLVLGLESYAWKFWTKFKV